MPDFNSVSQLRRTYHPLISTVLSGVLVIFSMEYWYFDTAMRGKSGVDYTTVTPLQIDRQSQHLNNAAPARSDNTANDIATDVTERVALKGMSVYVENDTTYLGLSLSRNTLYQIYTDVLQHRIILFLENTKDIASIPAFNYVNSAIKNITIANAKNHYLAVVLELSDNVDLKRLAMNNNEKLPELQFEFHNANKQTQATQLNNSTDYDDLINQQGDVSQDMMIQPAENESTISRPVVVVPPTAETPAFVPVVSEPEQKIVVDFSPDAVYQQAVELSDADQRDEAIHLLRNILRHESNYAPARELLSVLLIKDGKRAEAMTIIEKGLQQKPLYPGYLQLKARLLVDKGKLRAALRVLNQASPSIDANLGYYAFIAALDQQLGDYHNAQRIYEQLVMSQPANSDYWAALGITLDKQGKRSMALEAFAKAEEIGNLNPRIQRYLDSQE